MLFMLLHLFEKFDLNSKACITWKKGVHIAFRSQGSFYMSLYRVENFYVEIQYQVFCDGIAAIRTFSSEEQLQPYLDQIDLKEILSF